MFNIKSTITDFPKSPNKKHKVIVIAGGGLFGFIISNFMSYLKFDIREKIDTISGTSIGGILAMAYSINNRYSWINNVFKLMGPEIFSEKNGLGFINGPRYDNTNLKKLLNKFFKDKTLSDINDVNVIITSTDYTLGQPRIFENLNLKKEQDIKLSKIGLCTSAAPTYFPAQEIKWKTLKYDLNSIPLNEKILLLSAFEKEKIINDENFDQKSIIFDGGVLENIPIISTYTTLHNEFGIEPKDIDMFVFGTGNNINSERYTLNEINEWSVIKMLNKFLIPYITESNEQTSVFWGLQMGFNSFTYFNPVKMNGKMDDPNIMDVIEEQCIQNKEEFLKEITSFLEK